MIVHIDRKTVFSPCRNYRYTLWREWGDPLPGLSAFQHRADQYVMFIGLNPSTADETKDDPTIRRCIGFAKQWGYGALCMTNLFAWRATDPRQMKRQLDPVGPDNDKWLKACAHNADQVVAAWGTHGTHNGRDAEVRQIVRTLVCLRKTKAGHPEHPLYVPYDVKAQLL